MKTFGFVHVLLVLILLLAYQCTQAQDFTVTSRGDTLQGKIKIFNSGPDKKVQIVTDDRKKNNVPLVQVRMIQFNGEVFHPQKGPNGYSFMKLVKSGYLSLYAFQQENQTTFDGMLLAKKDGSTAEVPNLNFKKSMKRFLEDCASVSEKLDEGDYSKKDLNEIIDEYNKCLAGKASPVTSPEVVNPEVQKKTEPWGQLEEKIKSHPDFATRADALEMITEVRNKIRRSEKVPNFLIEGLKNALKETSLSEDLEAALKEIN